MLDIDQLISNGWKLLLMEPYVTNEVERGTNGGMFNPEKGWCSICRACKLRSRSSCDSLSKTLGTVIHGVTRISAYAILSFHGMYTERFPMMRRPSATTLRTKSYCASS